MTKASDTENPLVLRFAGQLVEQLGAQLYPSVTSSVAELISNAWDADAKNVWVTVPFEEAWTDAAFIEVLDDGHGMTREQAQRRYLVVGRNRRKELGQKSEGGRELHGRKGIGKLAAFGTAGRLECVTTRGDRTTAFAIDYDELRQLTPDKPYETDTVTDPEPLTHPETGALLEHGTRIRMGKLRAKRRSGRESFSRSMERRFALDSSVMKVHINGEPLQRFRTDLAIRLPRDGRPSDADLTVDSDGWAHETILIGIGREKAPQQRPVRWWIGFTEQPIPDEEMRGISVLTRGKLAQRPFTFEISQGTTGQLGQEYLVGEVVADWLDHGEDADEDLIQSNRDQLQLDHAELKPFLEWGQRRLRWALAQRNQLQRERRAGPEALGSEVEEVLQRTPPRSRERLRTLAARIAEFTQADSGDVAAAVAAVLDASEGEAARRIGDELVLEGDPDLPATWERLEAARTAVLDGAEGLARARANALDFFLLAAAEPPAPDLRSRIAENLWIVSPVLASVSVKNVDVTSDVTRVTIAPSSLLRYSTLEFWEPGVAPTELHNEGDDVLRVVTRDEDVTAPSCVTWAAMMDDSRRDHLRAAGQLDD